MGRLGAHPALVNSPWSTVGAGAGERRAAGGPGPRRSPQHLAGRRAPPGPVRACVCVIMSVVYVYAFEIHLSYL
jgi:hypothetical protein